MKIVNRYFEKTDLFFGGTSSEEVLTAVLCSSRRIKGAKTGRIFCSRYSYKCLHLASEKFVLASELNLSLATGLAS